MQTKKMSLANIQGKLSRTEMKNIMAGSGTCCVRGYWNSGSYQQQCSVSSASAQLAASQWSAAGGHFYWCCASC